MPCLTLGVLTIWRIGCDCTRSTIGALAVAHTRLDRLIAGKGIAPNLNRGSEIPRVGGDDRDGDRDETLALVLWPCGLRLNLTGGCEIPHRRAATPSKLGKAHDREVNDDCGI
jgi:hypothetical protein